MCTCSIDDHFHIHTSQLALLLSLPLSPSPQQSKYNLAKSALESFFGSGRPVPIKEGHINKKSAGGLRAEWKKKYLVLSKTELTYYPSLNVSCTHVHV